ncbi:uncharacterized protein [Littorina saxatilis]|uniref:uncharacterized protein isoform X3 n=1 Tax=Littorina saxatilis TaxID=31220 RepID=UPI0038B5434D
MNVFVFVLMVTGLPHLTAFNNCSDLDVYDEYREYDVSSCTEYGTDVCKNGVRGGFPANLTKGKTAPTVQDFEVTQYGEQTYENDILYNVSGLNISWKAPDNESLNLLKGFYLRINLVGSGAVNCILLDLQSFNMTSNTNKPLSFSYTLIPPELTLVGLCQVSLFSLPPTSSARVLHTSTTSTKTHTPPGVTTPALTDNGTRTEPIPTVDTNEPEQSSSAVHTSTSTHNTSTADETTVTWRSVSTDSATERSPTANSSTLEQSPSAADADVIVPAVLVPLVVLVGVVLGIYLCRHRQDVVQTCRNMMHKEDDVFSHSPEATSQNLFSTAPAGTGGLILPQISRKTVLLLASEDHKYFSQALNNFFTFLTLHCQCDVIFAPEHLADVRKTDNSYIWLSGKIDQADFVIIVTSEAAFRLYQASQNGMVYRQAGFGPEGDLFTPGIKHICGKITNGEDVSNAMMVHFDHTSTTYRLPISALPPSSYLLPSRLKSFLHHVHGLDENSMDLSRVNLPLLGNVEELEGGKEWLTAVHESRTFEQDHPDWFEEKFGRPVDRTYSGKIVDSLPVHGLSYKRTPSFFEENNYWNLQRRLSSVSTQAEKAFRRPTAAVAAKNPSVAYTESDFIPPSVFDTNSIYTVPYSDFTASERPPEVDDTCRVSHKFEMINERYEQILCQEKEQGQDPVSQKQTLIAGGQTEIPSAFQNPSYSAAQECSIEVQNHDRDVDYLSVSSVQSV